jgi:hypothetical protein
VNRKRNPQVAGVFPLCRFHSVSGLRQRPAEASYDAPEDVERGWCELEAIIHMSVQMEVRLLESGSDEHAGSDPLAAKLLRTLMSSSELCEQWKSCHSCPWPPWPGVCWQVLQAPRCMRGKRVADAASSRIICGGSRGPLRKGALSQRRAFRVADVSLALS